MESGTTSHRPKESPIQAALRSWDGLNLRNAAIAVTRNEGFTTAIVRTFGGLVSGQAAAFDLSSSNGALKAPLAIHAHLDHLGAKVAGSRAQALLRLRRLLEDTRLFKKARRVIERRQYRKLAASKANLEAMTLVTDGKIPLVVTAQRAADILAALTFAKQERIRLVLSGATEAWRVAPAIARAKVPVLMDLDRNLPHDFETLGARFDNAARLHRAGIRIAFGARGESHNVRALRQLAGIAVAWGLPRRIALAALTTRPAEIFGLKNRGVLRAGARANVVLWNGDPLELATRAVAVLIAGKPVPLTSHQSALLQRYRPRVSR